MDTVAGYFSSPVLKEPAAMPHTDWQGKGFPIGVVFHYTVGCNDDIKGTLESSGFGGAHFCVGKDGSIRQYAPLDVATFHCFHESHFFYGIEHTADPGTCELNDAQLSSSAMLAAALCEYIFDTHGFEVPPVHLQNSRTNDYAAGFHDHRDFDGDGSNTHTDHLYHWTWDRYLAEVEANMKDARVDSMLDGMSDYINGTAPPAGSPVARTRVYRVLNDAASKPRPDAMVGITQTAADGRYAPIKHPHKVPDIQA